MEEGGSKSSGWVQRMLSEIDTDVRPRRSFKIKKIEDPSEYLLANFGSKRATKREINAAVAAAKPPKVKKPRTKKEKLEYVTGLADVDNMVNTLPTYVEGFQKGARKGLIKKKLAELYARAKENGVSEKDIKAFYSSKESNPTEYHTFQKALKASILGGGGYEESSSESEDEMKGGLLGSIVSIASRAASAATRGVSAASAATRAATAASAATRAATAARAAAAASAASRAATASKAATAAATASKATTAASKAAQAITVAPTIGSRVFNAANMLGVAAGVGLPIYQVTQMVQQAKDDAAAKRAQEVAQAKADAETAAALADNQKAVDDAIAATTAERERYETEKRLIEEAYAAAAEDQRKQAEAFQIMMDMIMSGNTANNNIDSAPVPPVASGPTQEEIDAAIRDAAGVPPPPPSRPPPPPSRPPPSAPPPPPPPSAPTPSPAYPSYPPAPPPPSKRRKGGLSMRLPEVLLTKGQPTVSEIKKAIASARRRRKGGSDFL